MNAFVSGVVVLGAIAMANAGIISPAVRYVASPYGAVTYGAAPVYLKSVSPVEGQYVPDNTEHLYDDGSYKPESRAIPLANSPYGLTPAGSGLEGAYVPESRAIPLANSPYGLTPAGSGLEGAYVHDINEKLYDDGSYRPELEAIRLANSPYGLTPAGSGLEGAYVPELRAIPLANSPYGLTPAGSGLEGAYVQDINEKMYDDGSYKPEPHY